MALVLMSKYFHDNPKTLELFKDEIIKFIKQNNDTSNELTMGNMASANIREFLEKEGFVINVTILPVGGKPLFNGNLKMIDKANKVLVVQFENSKNIQKFIDYAKEKDKDIKVLQIKIKSFEAKIDDWG